MNAVFFQARKTIMNNKTFFIIKSIPIWLIVSVMITSNAAMADSGIKFKNFNNLSEFGEYIYAEPDFIIPCNLKIEGIKPEVKEKIHKISEKIKECNAEVTLWGYTYKSHKNYRDKDIQDAKNRAELIKELLIGSGVPSENITVTNALDRHLPSEFKEKDYQTVAIEITRAICPADRITLRLTTPETGNTYITGNILSHMWNQEKPKVNYQVSSNDTSKKTHTVSLQIGIFPISSDNTEETLRRLEEQKTDLAILSGIRLFSHLESMQQKSRIRIMMPLCPSVYHLVVLTSRMNNPNDIKDLSAFCKGSPKSLSEYITNQILKGNGHQAEKKNLMDCGNDIDVLKGLLSLKYEGAAISGGMPDPTVSSLFGNSRLFSFLSINKAASTKLCEENSFIQPASIVKNLYPGQEKEVHTVGNLIFLVSRKEIDPTIVAELIEEFFRSIDHLKYADPCFGSITYITCKTGLEDVIHREKKKHFLHKGAIDYFKLDNKLNRP